MDILFLGNEENDRLERFGIELVNDSIHRIQASGPVKPRPVTPPDGPYFRYESGPHLFLGRKGVGPLHIAWDTNLLIDYFDHGLALWQGASLPEVIPGEQGEQLEALQLIVCLWVLRDIRFHISRLIISDSKKKLSEERRKRRISAWHEFCNAITLVDAPDDYPPPPLILPDAELERALKSVPIGYDRSLVRDAVKRHLHVFLTRDKGVLSAKSALRPFGLHITNPQDLLEELGACGALHCLLAPEYLHWPLPDQKRVSHLIKVLSQKASD